MMMAGDKFKRASRCAIVISQTGGPLLESVAIRLGCGGVITEFLRRPLIEPPGAFDLIVLRDKTPEALSWAKGQQRRGSLVLPDPHKVETIKDRWACRELMTLAGANLPESMIGTRSVLITSGVERLLPLVIKRRDVHGTALTPIYTKSELVHEISSFAANAELVAERYVVGKHYTAAFVAEETFVFLRPPFALTTKYAERLAPPPQEIVETVSQYRSATGLAFGKVDVVVTPSGKVFLVDCGVSPNLWLVAEADRLLTNYFFSQLSATMNSVTRMEHSHDQHSSVRFG